MSKHTEAGALVRQKIYIKEKLSKSTESGVLVSCRIYVNESYSKSTKVGGVMDWHTNPINDCSYIDIYVYINKRY